MQQSSTLRVGLDVHKDSIEIATADPGPQGEVRHVGSIGGDLASLDRALRKLISKGLPLHVVYEAGPYGFIIWHHLAGQDLSCKVVVAPSSSPQRCGDCVKTDCHDVIMLAHLPPAGGLAAMRVPSTADEAVSDLGAHGRLARGFRPQRDRQCCRRPSSM